MSTPKTNASTLGRMSSMVPEGPIDMLGAGRLSNDTDETTSPERQVRHIEGYGQFKGYNLVDIAMDLDTSGAISPFDREQLGPWLRPPLLSRWQVLCVPKLDRLTRSLLDFQNLWHFLTANNKVLVTVMEGIDFSTPHGKMMADMLVMFAEFERETIRARTKDSWDALRANGQYAGMGFPFGYIPVRLAPKGWGLGKHPRYAATVEEIVDRVIAGQSLRQVCRWLQSEGIPTPRNVVREFYNEQRAREGKEAKPLPPSQWTPSSLTKILRSPNLIGLSVADGQVMRADDGMTITRAVPLIDPDIKWKRLRDAMDGFNRRGPRANSSPWLQVGFCPFCKSPLYMTQGKSGSGSKVARVYRYYACSKHVLEGADACPSSRRMRADWLDPLVEDQLLAKLGDAELIEEVEIPASDTSAAMMRIADAIGALASRIAIAEALGQDEDVTRMKGEWRRHQENLAKLADTKPVPAHKVPLPTGKTFGQTWATLTDDSERNALLRRWQVRFEANADDGVTEFSPGLLAYAQRREGWRVSVGQSGRTVTLRRDES